MLETQKGTLIWRITHVEPYSKPYKEEMKAPIGSPLGSLFIRMPCCSGDLKRGFRAYVCVFRV